MVVQKINQDLCIGCGVCYLSCPEDVYRFDEKKRVPIVRYPKDCVGCLFCGLLCPTGNAPGKASLAKSLPNPV